METKLSGIAASQGLAHAKLLLVEEEPIKFPTGEHDPISEKKLIEESLCTTKNEIAKLKVKSCERLGASNAEIFDAHMAIANDPTITEQAIEIVKSEKCCAATALQKVMDANYDLLSKMEDAYMRERAVDVKDVLSRAIRHSLGLQVLDLGLINEEVVIVAEDLTPSQTSQLNKKFVKAFAVDVGSRTSHAAIMARSLGIPAVLGLRKATKLARKAKTIIIDGNNGEVVFDPSQRTINDFEKKRQEYKEKLELLESFRNKTTRSSDDHKVEIEVNIGNLGDLKNGLNSGAEGVGLFRTEFLYMESDNWPSEEKQTMVYSDVLKASGKREVVIRTLDIGGDKNLSYYDFPTEMNPFLGYRAIRFCLQNDLVFRTQLRALLRASPSGNLAIMFPMIATIEELQKAKTILNTERLKLEREGIKVANNIQIGMMMEVPSAAILANEFAKHVDFFSIGSNDLIQYAFAADRMSSFVSYLYQPLNPALLKFIAMIIREAHAQGKWVAMCGEMAGTAEAIPLLLGLGLDRFSMSGSSILETRELISRLNFAKCKQLAAKALDCSSHLEVQSLLSNFTKE